MNNKYNTLTLIACLISLYVLSGCDEEKAKPQAPLRQVKTMTVIGGNGTYEQSFSGRLHSTSEVSYSFKLSGTIKSLPVQKGDRVQAGDVLATLDASDFELEVEKARAALAESQASYRNAKSNYERVKKLYAAGNTSRNALDSARANAETAAAATQANRKALEIASKNVSYTILKSEKDCAIASVNPNVDENVNAGTQIIFATCGNELEVKLNIPESAIAFMKKGMDVVINFPALPDRDFRGKVSEVGVSSVGGSTFPVDVLVVTDNISGLKAGLSADVMFTIDASKNNQSPAIIIPAIAVSEDQDGRFVFVVEPKSDDVAIVNRTPVTIGEILQHGMEIKEGLKPGLQIVTAGVSVLRDGMEVKYTKP